MYLFNIDMSSSILEKLKVKPIPKKIESFKINIQEPILETPVDIKTKIIDKTKDSQINRDELLKNIDVNVFSKLPEKKSFENIIPSPPKKIKKLSKKIKLETDKDEVKDDSTSKRKSKKIDMNIIADNIDKTTIEIDPKYIERLPSKEKSVLIKANAYYMNNREIFVNFVNALFKPYKEEFLKAEETITCDKPDDVAFSLLTHQKLVRDYLNIYTPYRGLLLYHGLGSGKTCSSIAIAEGMKNDKQVIVMTPASLRVNYLQELKNCGGKLYKTNQYWEFIDIDNSNNKEELVQNLSNILNISSDYITKNGGAWLVNVKKNSNYNTLSEGEKVSLDSQINEMITSKYRFLNYNGLRNSHLKDLTRNYTINPFDNKVIIIDEAHNFVSRIVNKIQRPESLSMRLYEYLLSAENCKIVLLTGTPIINYPNEIGILFNILRGYIKTWSIPLKINTNRKIDKNELIKIFSTFDILDYIDYKSTSKILTVTRNPFGFINIKKDDIYKGVSNTKIKKKGDINDNDFIKILISILNKNEIDVVSNSIQVNTYKALPDTLESFQNYFIEQNGKLKNENLLKRRIIGLTSYFRSAQEKLMPAFNKDSDFKVIKIPMSDYQFGVYEQARIQERKQAKAGAKRKLKQTQKDLYEDSISSYRIFSRAFCNFVFPDNRRPMPKDGQDIESVLNKNKNVNEDILDVVDVNEKLANPDGLYGADDIDLISNEIKEGTDNTYNERIKKELQFLQDNANKYLSPTGLETYSPKFLTVLENLKDADYRGLHLIYTQFRTVEGIGILSLILDANGFTQFKIKKNDANIWSLDIPNNKKGLPMYALYTGTETAEEKEIIRNIFNSNWDSVPNTITDELTRISTNNFYGEIIKVLMLTASGAEGISLKNTRYVHIIEPYWHPVRVEQVIGRAKRICSHQDLPPQLRTVTVFLYLMTFTEEQVSGDNAVELRLNDGSKFDDSVPVTTDEALFEISTIKEKISKQLLNAVKEASIDCSVYNKPGTKDAIKCFSFGKTSPKNFSYQPSISNEESDSITELNKPKITWKAKEIKLPIDGIKKTFARNPSTNEIYDLDDYNEAVQYGTEILPIGKLLEKPDGKFKFIKI